MDVLEHLTQEHRKVEQLMSQLESTEPGAQRDRLVEELSAALAKHMMVEEQFLYPIVAEVVGAEPETEAEVEHNLAREGLRNLDELRSKPGFGAALDMVRAGIAHHVEEEEHQIFPRLRSEAADQIAALDPEQLETQIDLTGESKEQLYKLAQEAGVPGRSTMSKSELAEAIAERG